MPTVSLAAVLMGRWLHLVPEEKAAMALFTLTAEPPHLAAVWTWRPLRWAPTWRDAQLDVRIPFMDVARTARLQPQDQTMKDVKM